MLRSEFALTIHHIAALCPYPSGWPPTKGSNTMAKLAQAPDQQQQQLIVRMPSELHSAVRHRADTDDLTMAQVVRRALRQYLGDDDRVPTPA